MRGVNLIPAHRLERRARAARVRRWCVGCAAYAVALVAAWAAANVAWPDRRTAFAEEIAKIESHTREDLAAAAALKPRLAQAFTTLAANRTIGNQPDWSGLLALSAGLLGEDAVLRTCRLEPLDRASPTATGSAGTPRITSFRLRLEGLGRSQAAVLGYVRELEECGIFESVALIETRGEAFGRGQAIAFNIECVLSDEPTDTSRTRAAEGSR